MIQPIFLSPILKASNISVPWWIKKKVSFPITFLLSFLYLGKRRNFFGVPNRYYQSMPMPNMTSAIKSGLDNCEIPSLLFWIVGLCFEQLRLPNEYHVSIIHPAWKISRKRQTRKKVFSPSLSSNITSHLPLISTSCTITIKNLVEHKNWSIITEFLSSTLNDFCCSPLLGLQYCPFPFLSCPHLHKKTPFNQTVLNTLLWTGYSWVSSQYFCS